MSFADIVREDAIDGDPGHRNAEDIMRPSDDDFVNDDRDESDVEDDAASEEWAESTRLLDVMAEVVGTVLEDTEDQLTTLREFAEDGNCEAVVSAGRALRAAATSLNAVSLVALCRQIEVAGRAGNTEAAQTLVSSAEFEFARIRCALANPRAA